MENTSWEKASKWYGSIASKEGHYFHRKIIFPALREIMDLKKTKDPSVLDLGCGPGAFAAQIPKNIPYCGVDLSRSLIRLAKKNNEKNRIFVQGDITKPLQIEKKDFSHAVFILSLQNVAKPDLAISQVKKHLRPNGKLILVLNHPCFRIPRQTGWQIDEAQKLQYRRVNHYMSPLKIPIQAHPGKEKESVLWSYHFPISSYFHFLKKSQFSVCDLQEWCSDKKSYGKKAKMENRARQEIPLFLTIVANTKPHK